MPPAARPSPPFVFRPSPAVRWLLGLFGAFTGLLTLAELYLAARLHEPARAIAVAPLLVPIWVGAAAARKRVVVDVDGLRSRTLFASRSIPWGDVYWLDQTRRSFVVASARGNVSAGWLAARERDRMMRLILQYGKLVISSERTRWGIRARFVPRTRPIAMSDGRSQPPDRAEGGPDNQQGQQSP